jgi:hypothetical protein
VFLKKFLKAPLKGRLLALLTNNILGWKGLSGTNTITYYVYLCIMTVKSFITSDCRGLPRINTLAYLVPISVAKKSFIRLTPGSNVKKLFTSVIY